MAIREDNKKVQDNLDYKKDKEESQKDNGMQVAEGSIKDFSENEILQLKNKGYDIKKKGVDAFGGTKELKKILKLI
jgi:hypothetical protein